MDGSTVFDYYYGDESSQFSFYRIPRQLVAGQQFKKISTDAKLLYGLLLDRMGLSARNGWYKKEFHCAEILIGATGNTPITMKIQPKAVGNSGQEKGRNDPPGRE